MFTLSGAISWVGKEAQFNANAVSHWEGQWLIAQAITEWCIEARGPRHLCFILPASPLFSFHNQDEPPWEVRLPTAEEWLAVPRCNHWVLYHEWGQALQCCQDHGHRQWDPWAALTPSPSPSLDHRLESDRSSVSTSSSVSSRSNRSGGSRHWHYGYAARRPEVTWKSICPSLRMKTRRTLSPIKVGIGIWWCIIKLGAKIVPSSPMSSAPYRATQGELVRSSGLISLWMAWAQDWYHSGWHDHCAGWGLQHCQGSGCPEPGAFPITNGWQRNGVRLGCMLLRTPPNPCGFIPRKVPARPHVWIEARPLVQWATQAVESEGGLPKSNQ